MSRTPYIICFSPWWLIIKHLFPTGKVSLELGNRLHKAWEGVTAREQLSKKEPQTLVRRLASQHDSFSPSVKISEVREII